MPIAPAEAGNLATESFVVPGLRASAEPGTGYFRHDPWKPIPDRRAACPGVL